VTETVPAPTQHTTAEKLAELHARLELAKEPGGEKAAAKRDKKGIPSARARIHALLDPGTFLEVGALAKTPNDPNALYGDGCVTGHGMIDGRPVGVFSHDQTVFQGSVGEMFGRKVARLMEWCAMVGCPIIGINDSAGARIQDTATSLAWYAELGRRHELLSGIVPQISLIFGKCAGGAVYSPIQTDLVVAVRDQGYMFVTGPDVIKDVTGEEVSLDELGGADAQARYGNIHQVVEDEAAAFAYVRD
jgi:acetyl-CoA carboxylase carboxyltransferase component